MSDFDYAIVGAGINGCALAYFLTQTGASVALVDATGIAAGGSGAAGAFIAPKITKSGPLKEISDAAFEFSLAFYNEHFPQAITNAPLLHLAKHHDENSKVAYFKAHTPLHVSEPDEALWQRLQPHCKEYEALYLEQSAVVDAQQMCAQLAADAVLCVASVEMASYNNERWHLGGLTCKQVIFATGAYTPVLHLPYLKLRGVWGHRIDIATSTEIPLNIHQQVSISKSTHGKAAIGATHNVHYHPQSNMPYDVDAGRAELLQKAAFTLDLGRVEVVHDYMGLRSGSNDYLPMIGSLVDADATLQKLPESIKGHTYAREDLCYFKNAYMINGTGGYGFVLGPWLAKNLAEYLLFSKPIDTRIEPTRFYERWVKKGVLA